VVNPRSDEVEPPEFIVNKAKQALQYFNPDQVYLNPDCGFGTFAERPMNAPDVAAQKLESIVIAARELRKEYA
jgi:5-methyltetrahydropteroyltriglutamate--homocysteine methyltransferase